MVTEQQLYRCARVPLQTKSITKKEKTKWIHLLDFVIYNSVGSGGSGEHDTGATSTESEYANLYDLRTYSSTSNPRTVH
jgi:hypothetical protein